MRSNKPLTKASRSSMSPRTTSHNGFNIGDPSEPIWSLELPLSDDGSPGPTYYGEEPVLERLDLSTNNTPTRTSGFTRDVVGLTVIADNRSPSLTTTEETWASVSCYKCSIDIPWMCPLKVVTSIGIHDGFISRVMSCQRCGMNLLMENLERPYTGDLTASTRSTNPSSINHYSII